MTWFAPIPIAALAYAAANVVWATRQAFVMARDGESNWLSGPMVLWTAIAATLTNLLLPGAIPSWPRRSLSLWCVGLALAAAHLPAVIVAQRMGASRRKSFTEPRR